MTENKTSPKCTKSLIIGPLPIRSFIVHNRGTRSSLSAAMDAYTCASCGFTEIYSDKQGLENINKCSGLNIKI